jgi:hypothetical protein
VLFIFPILFTFCYVYDKYDHMVNNSLAVRNIYCCKYVWWFTGYYFTDESVLSMCCLYSQFYLLSVMYMINMITWSTTASLWEIYIVVNMYGDLQVIILQINQYCQCVVYIPNFVYFLYSKCWISSAVIFIFYEDDLNYVYLIWRSNNIKKKWKDRTSNTVVSNHVNSDHVPSFFFCLDLWNVRQTTSGVYAISITVTTSTYHSCRRDGWYVIVIWRCQENGRVNADVRCSTVCLITKIYPFTMLTAVNKERKQF